LRHLLKAATLPRSTFYYQVNALRSADKYQELKDHIKTIYDRHKGRYGYRRICVEVRRLGQVVSQNTVQRLMGELGLKSLVKVKKYQSYRGEAGRIAPNHLDRRFTARLPNEKWVTDVTEFKVAGEKLYLSPVLDLFNGEIVAFETARRPVFSMVADMLKQAIAKLSGDEKPMVHSDQGWQYQMPAYQRMLGEMGMVQSMSRKGNCHDNAAMESFFGTLKSELFYLSKFASIDQLERALPEYIHYYNHERIKLSLGGCSPAQYRMQTSQV
jgi:putative transposase